MLLSPEVLTILILNAVFAIFAITAFVISVKIYLYWDANSTSQAQYSLEKQGYLGAVIIKYIFITKAVLFLFFIFTLDKISNVITGAMCAAGVVDATSTGVYVIALKILNIYLFALWLKLHSQDIADKTAPYTKMKFGFFIALFSLLMLEIFLETLMFNSIEIEKMVSCCGSIYSSSSTSAISLLFQIDTAVLLLLFYGNYLLIVLLYFFKNRYIFSILNLLFLPVSLIALILFFGTYIYELPSHHCPFCFLQSDYYYVGYMIYALLFLGTFSGLSVVFVKEREITYKTSLLFNSLYVILLSLYVVVYYVRNGVFL